MIAGGAFAAAIAGLLDAPIPVQVGTFAVVSALGLAGLRPAVKRRLHRGAEPGRAGVEAIEGSEATVIELVAEGRGMVKIGGELWTARPYDVTQTFEPGVLVRVIEVKGAT